MNRFYITPEEYEIARKNGISKERVDYRVRMQGWDVEKAITTPLRKRSPWKKWEKIALQNGIDYKCFMQRINKLGWSPERAATIPKRERNAEAIRWARQFKKSFFTEEEKELMKKNGIKYDTAFKRVTRRFWDRKKAVTTPPLSISDPNHPYRKKMAAIFRENREKAARKGGTVV